MRFRRLADALEPHRLTLLAGAIALQWLSTLLAAAWARGDEPIGDPVVLLNVLVLGPLALAAAYRLALELAGLALGAWTLLVWLAAPWVLVALALSSYEATARDDVLPVVLGLEPERGFAAGAAVLVAAALTTVPGRWSAVAAGAALGVAALLVPATLVFAAAAAAALLVAWRLRDVAGLAAALLPVLVALALWRGFESADRSYDALIATLDGFREYFFSERLVQWLPFAGALALGRRSVALAVLLGGGFVGFALLVGARTDSVFADGAVFRLLLPGLPAYAVLTAALPLLVPTLSARLRAEPG